MRKRDLSELIQNLFRRIIIESYMLHWFIKIFSAYAPKTVVPIRQKLKHVKSLEVLRS